MRDWNEPAPQGTDWETVRQVEMAMREIELGRAPETAWEVDCYAAAYAAGIFKRPLN
jgi:hypothetical protein